MYSTPLILDTKREGVDTDKAATRVETMRLAGTEPAGGGYGAPLIVLTPMIAAGLLPSLEKVIVPAVEILTRAT